MKRDYVVRYCRDCDGRKEVLSETLSEWTFREVMGDIQARCFKRGARSARICTVARQHPYAEHTVRIYRFPYHMG